ncbi:AraC family transcriptional regulator [Massilibacteroides sp.]|uniref:helix-turn-helix domain-containing protein n=1 Tax=Massilibacteroides sp. TaxID=2034766 RepID=UPI00260BE1A1|nr:AraC family transcriptional regulator [Massilibacteroides sp.]MDD4516746.1 AraC family transcriptional regulator [Massilibacteroides sp.]
MNASLNQYASCQGEDYSGIIFISHEKTSEAIDYIAEKHSFVFFKEGHIRFSINGEKRKELDQPSFFLLSPGSAFRSVALLPSSIVIISVIDHLDIKLPFRSNLSTRMKDKFILPLNVYVKNYLILLNELFSFGFLNKEYMKLKIAELMLIIDMTYSIEEKQGFFSVIINNEFYFLSFIRKNYKRAKSVRQLAELMDYSISGFEKKFRKVFSQSASLWLKEQKKTAIYEDLLKTDKPLKEISLEYGFCSTTHFNNYCKGCFGCPPGKLRKQLIITENTLNED